MLFFSYLGVSELVFSTKNFLPAAAGTVTIILATIFLVIITFFVLTKKPHFIKVQMAIVVAIVLMGTGIAISYYTNIIAVSMVFEQNSESLAEIIILEDASHGTFGQTSRANVTINGKSAECIVRWQKDQEVALYGSKLTAKVSFKPLKTDDIQRFRQGLAGYIVLEEPNYCGYLADIFGAISSFRNSRLSTLAKYDGDGAAILQGMLFGSSTSLRETDSYQTFKVAGLMHLIAVSGSHLAIVAGLISTALRKTPIRKSVEFAILAVVLVCYCILTALQPSAIRSTVMALAYAASLLCGRRGHSLSALGIAALSMLLVTPNTAFSLGFWLSVFAVFGIVVFSGLVQSWVRSSSLAMTLTAQTAILPISTPFFSMFSLIGPLANIIVAPLMMVLVAIGIVFFCLPQPLFSMLQWLAIPLCFVADIVAFIASVLANLPYASIPTYCELPLALAIGIIIALLLYLVWPKIKGYLLALASGSLIVIILAINIIFTPLTVGPQMIMLDVGQGDAILVRDGNTTLLIDTGPSKIALLNRLAQLGITRIDALLITHLHEDHTNGLAALDGTVIVDKLLFAAGIPVAKSDDDTVVQARQQVGDENIIQVTQGTVVRLSERLSLICLWPNSLVSKGDNADSVCMLLCYDANADEIPEFQVLFTGDAEAQVLEAIAADGLLDDIDVLKVGHHGSAASVSSDVLSLLKPEIALISVGEDNRYGHPKAQALQQLIECGAKVLRTDTNGNIKLEFSSKVEASSITITCANIDP
ncbi:MAG: DNA internalization-related competence protein ComEC/Rec2 [Coriobacteriales bacterium]|nr:DNA internalization-related competence protein ComEC/Rec2 [Coriobacteriales bacterium]